MLDSFNNASRDEDNILDQIYIKQRCSDFYYEDLNFHNILKCIPLHCSICHFNAVQNYISSNTIRLWLHHTVDLVRLNIYIQFILFFVSTRGVHPVSGSGALGPDLYLYLLFFVSDVTLMSYVDPENQPGFIRTGSGSRALGLTKDVWHQKYENKKEGLQNYLEYSYNSISNIFYP